MTWSLVLWLLMFILQAGLLGRCMYALLSLSDLEQDFINPYDLCTRLNRFVLVELAAQIMCLVVVVAGRMWFATALQTILTAFLVHQHIRKQTYVDVTDVFKQLKTQTRWRSFLFGGYCVSFVFITYRVVETTIHTVLTPEGREIAKKLFREAASAMPGY